MDKIFHNKETQWLFTTLEDLKTVPSSTAAEIGQHHLNLFWELDKLSKDGMKVLLRWAKVKSALWLVPQTTAMESMDTLPLSQEIQP